MWLWGTLQRIITILNNSANFSNGLVIFATTVETTELKLEWENNNTVPVSLSADSEFTGVRKFSLNAAKPINISDDALVVKLEMDPESYPYSYVSESIQSGIYFVARNVALKGSEVTVNKNENNVAKLTFSSTDNTLYIPSDWIGPAGPYTTSVYVPPVTHYSVIVDQTSLNGSTKYVTGSNM